MTYHDLVSSLLTSPLYAPSPVSFTFVNYPSVLCLISILVVPVGIEIMTQKNNIASLFSYFPIKFSKEIFSGTL